MYEKNREASALAAISRAIAQQQKDGMQNNAPAIKPPRPSGSDVEAIDAPTPISSKKKRKNEEESLDAKQIKSQIVIEKKSKREKEKSAEKEKYLGEIEPPPILHQKPPPTPSAPQLPSTNEAFRDWYLAKLADTFEREIEGINDADAPVGSKVLLQALESNLTLFSVPERKVALAAHGIKTRN